MTQLSEISVELAEKLLGKVSYENQLEACKVAQRAGSYKVFINSISHLAGFLHVEPIDGLLAVGGNSSLCYVDLAKLKPWIDNNFGDSELADAIQQETLIGDIYIEKLNA